MKPHKRYRKRQADRGVWLRLKLIIAFDGDVTKAETALGFVNNNPEASEEYQRFKEWKLKKFEEDLARKGGRLIRPVSTEGPSER